MIDLKVVILEDDSTLLEKLTRILRREVREVVAFDNSLEAYENIPKLLPDIIISDILMKNMTGLEMYKKLKDRGMHIPIILASAFSEPEYFLEAVKLRVNHFLIKPINIDELLEELKIYEHKLKQKDDLKRKENLLIVQSKMAEMGEMIQNIAHQWKQPLNTLSICTSALEIERQYSQDYIDEMKASIKYMDQTISDFHDYFEPNKRKQEFKLYDTVEKVEKLISSQVKCNNIEIIKDIDENISLYSYENELIQVVINLLKNAIDQLVMVDNKRILFINVFNKDENIIINVRDTAGGIKLDNEDLNIIFNEYFTTKGSRGTGIGLYMSKIIVENNLDGRIDVSNEEIEHDGLSFLGASFDVVISPSS